jgi:hypothetical protein
VNSVDESDTGVTRTDTQGAVEFVVTPPDLDVPGETLDFDVSMNTHLVDLGWDLASQSTLSTDTGLEGAKTLTLTVRDTTVPKRVFTWSRRGLGVA